MLPARFDYSVATSVDEVLAILGERGEDAKILAGGQSLIPLMKLRFASPAHLVDVNRIAGLATVAEKDGSVSVGAMCRHNQLASDRLIASRYGVMASAAPMVADPIIRNLGTIGGSLAHCDPAADWGSVMLALGAQVVARSTAGERVIPIAEFIQGTFTTALTPTEMITEIRIPKASGPAGGTYLKLERKVGDFATVAVAVHVEMAASSNGTGRIARAGIGMTAVGPVNLPARSAEAILAGAQPSPALFEEAAQAAAAEAQPFSDHRGSASYKKAVVAAYVRRGLEAAVRQARSN